MFRSLCCDVVVLLQLDIVKTLHFHQSSVSTEICYSELFETLLFMIQTLFVLVAVCCAVSKDDVLFVAARRWQA